MHDHPSNWEPQKMGNWRAMFEQDRGAKQPAAASPMAQAEMPRELPPDDEGLALDLSVYKPWILQRGRSRPAMMLEFRRYEPRSGLWGGWAIAYPHLISLEYTGDTLLSLDFGTRQIVIEGRGLDTLAQHIQQGTVLGIIEHSVALWPGPVSAAMVTTIRPIEGSTRPNA